MSQQKLKEINVRVGLQQPKVTRNSNRFCLLQIQFRSVSAIFRFLLYNQAFHLPANSWQLQVPRCKAGSGYFLINNIWQFLRKSSSIEWSLGLIFSVFGFTYKFRRMYRPRKGSLSVKRRRRFLSVEEMLLRGNDWKTPHCPNFNSNTKQLRKCSVGKMKSLVWKWIGFSKLTTSPINP